MSQKHRPGRVSYLAGFVGKVDARTLLMVKVPPAMSSIVSLLSRA